jgi:CelD/BcsL family acetyltransferase involved in cellulose biosynthesis
MKIRVEKLTEEEYSLWNDFITKSSQGSFFCTTEWANLLSYTFNRQYEVIVLKDKDAIVAGMLIFVQKRLGYRMITPVALYPYSGPVICDHTDKKYQKIVSYEMEYTAQLAEHLSHQFHFWTIQTPPDFIDTRAFLWSNCHVEPSYTYRLNITSWDQCKQNFNQSVRKKVRQADRDKYSFIESEEKSSFIRMYINSYHRHNKKPLIDEQTLDKFLGMALKIPQVKLYYVEKDNEFLAARVVVEDANMVYDLLAGSDDPNGHASAFLVYKILETYAKNKIVFDFLGADHPMIEEFKRGFGGQLVHGFKITSSTRFPLSWMIKIRTRTALLSRKI